MMMRAGKDGGGGPTISRRCLLASVGEPLNPEAVVWSEKVFGQPFHDNWWQTETGGIMIANPRRWRSSPAPWASRCRASRRGSSSARTAAARTRPRRDRRAGAAPRLAVDDARLPARSRRATTSAFVDGWYLSGDLAMQDADGYFWFVGRADDLIKTSGHLIGPFEVESALIEHEAVAEAGVIGVPGRDRGRVVKAYVTLTPGSSRPRRWNRPSAAMPARSSAPPSPRARSCSARPCPRPDPARSCAAC
jgi:acetyl-CoA synthetase